MIMKSILAATAVAATLAVAAPAAEAHHHHHRLHVNLGINIGSPGYVDPGFYYPPPPPPHFYHPRPVYADPGYGYADPADYQDDYGISCGEGRRIVWQSGFHDVRTVECDGRNYKYTGFRHGDSWIVVLDSETGEIIRRNRY
jgi:hypothetical protein